MSSSDDTSRWGVSGNIELRFVQNAEILLVVSSEMLPFLEKDALAIRKRLPRGNIGGDCTGELRLRGNTVASSRKKRCSVGVYRWEPKGAVLNAATERNISSAELRVSESRTGRISLPDVVS